jgi:prepilin-type N-terminal cleavage/methylation domain-containing protein
MQNYTPNNRKSSPKAFSLLELSIVILIASILVTGALSVSSSMTDERKIIITKDRMDVIYKALGTFLLKNKRLPCPASLLEIKSTSTTYGTELYTTVV